MHIDKIDNIAKIDGFNPLSFLESIGPGRSILNYEPGRIVFRQGDPAPALFYLQKGAVQISTISGQGKEGVTASHRAGEFFGQESLVGQGTHRSNAITTGASTIARIDSQAMLRVMKAEPALAIMLLSFVLSRNIEIEEDLVDHLVNSSEKRLARLLLKLAGVNDDGETSGELEGIIPKMSQEVLASRVGTTRGRINYFMNKFRKLGYIDYNRHIVVRSTLANIISQDDEMTPVSFMDQRQMA